VLTKLMRVDHRLTVAAVRPRRTTTAAQPRGGRWCSAKHRASFDRCMLLAGLSVTAACGESSAPQPASNAPGILDASPMSSGGTGAAAESPSAGAGGAESAPTPASRMDAGPALDASSCASLTRGACMESESCTLVLDSTAARAGVYVCRPAESPCEVGLAQSALSNGGAARAECQARTGCSVVAGSCYCACRGSGQTAVPDDPATRACSCACGGGAPPRCALGVE
jgi:hypothetical protein